MILLKDLWINHILPLLSPIDLSHFQQVSKRCLTLSKPFQHTIDHWIQLTNNNSSHWCLYQASKQGLPDLVLLFISKRANNWNEALYGASQGGHKDLIKMFIDKGANDWKWALCYAKLGGHRDLVEFFNQKMSESKNPNVT